MLAHRSGFRPGRDQISTHARRRYRLLSNPSLWLVCYRPADVRDQQSVIGAPIPSTVQMIMQERNMLGRTHTQLVRKEFMLFDTQSFPMVMPPGVNTSPHGQQNMEYPGNVMAHMSKNQQAAYKQRSQQMQQHPQAPGMEVEAGFNTYPSKRLRRGSYMRELQPSATAIPGPPHISIKRRTELEEEQENAVDYMDAITPRELALNRYLQHHEWLEEVLSSPYDTHQIVPPQLGLGRKGELESLTQDFFDAPMSLNYGKYLASPGNINSIERARAGKPVVKDVPVERVGRLEGNRAEDFREKAAQRMAKIATEIEGMEQEHLRNIAQLRSDRELKNAERLLGADTLAIINDLGGSKPVEANPKLESQIAALESKYQKKIKSVPVVECLDKGGIEENIPNGKAGVIDGSLTETPDLLGNLMSSTPDASQVNADVSPANGNIQTPDPQANAQQQPTQPLAAEASMDATTDDFVMVNRDDALPSPEKEQTKPAEMMDYSSLQADAQQLGTNDLTDFDSGADVNFEPNDFGEGIDFGDMDTAGDALSGYAQEIVNMGGGKRDDLGPDSPTVQSHLSGMGAPSAHDGSSAP